MENIYSNIINDCKNYCNLIFQFENYLNQIYYNLQNQYSGHRGYLIDLKEFEEFKNDINYQIYKTNINEYDEMTSVNYIEKFISLEKTLEFKRFEQVKINSYHELEELLKNNQYIFINFDLWVYSCKKGKESEPFISYYINNNELFFELKKNEYVYFHHNNNIINSNTYISNKNNILNNNQNNINFQNGIKNIDNNVENDFNVENKYKNYNGNPYQNNQNQFTNNNNQNDFNNNNKNQINNKEKILNLINVMKELFLFEKKMNDPKNLDKEENNSGYFINKISIDKWKQGTNYDKIKENFFEKYLTNDNNTPSNEQNEEIFNYLMKLNNIYDINNNNPLKLLNNLEEKEFESFTKTNSFVLFNKNLFELINDKKEINENGINYKIDNNNKISFQFKSLNCIFYIYNNIIFSKLDSNVFLLIKFYIFEEEFKKNINSGLNNTSKTYIMINRNNIDKFKEYLRYDIIYNYIKNEDIINIDNNSNPINNKMIYQIVQNMPKDNKKLIPVNINFDTKNLNLDILKEEKIGDEPNKKIFKYVKDFGIIDANLFRYISSYIGNKNNFIFGRFYFIKSKILIIFKDKKESEQYYFQIGYINEKNEFIIEYLIDIDYDKTKVKDINSFSIYFNENNNNNIFTSIYINKSTNTFLLENKICYFYKISGNNNINSNNGNNNNNTDFLNIKTNMIFFFF